ncbi:hypothetical protein JCM19047_4558 [Bacillus sp. JCM 19047]|nr:hypothetical protein JCM19047_4558 [Bacillus sp. JCM 19047]
MISSASSEDAVTISIVPSFGSGVFKSIKSPFNFPANAFFLSPGLIEAAIASVDVPLGNSFLAPSGNTNSMCIHPFFFAFFQIKKHSFL